MVTQLKQAIKKAEALPDEQQQVIAAIIEAELEDENRWQRRFDETTDTLLKIAERAKRQYDSGSCTDL